MKKFVLVALCVIAVLLVVLGVGVWWLMNRPLYQPGQVRTLASLQPPAQTAAADYWEMGDGIRLCHFAQGQGRNILFIHGGPGYPPAQAYPGLSRLGEDYRVVYYHQRGCGKSTRPIDRFTSDSYFQNLKTLEQKLGLGAQVADIERIRRLLGEDKLTIIGHSFGAFLAALYAAEFPERVRGLVLISPATVLVMPSSEPDLFETVGRLLPASSKPGYEDFRKRYFDFRDIWRKSEADLRALNAEFLPYYRQAAAAKRPLPAMSSPAEDNGGWMVQAMYFSMGRRHDFRPALSAVKAPVLLIHGADDLQSEAGSDVYLRAFPSARLAMIKNAGHFSFIDQPDEFASVTGRFLASLERTGPGGPVHLC